MQRSSGLILPEYRADVGQREYNIYKGQKKYPWSGSYTPGKDKVRRSIS
jgi:hypothetical protein